MATRAGTPESSSTDAVGPVPSVRSVAPLDIARSVVCSEGVDGFATFAGRRLAAIVFVDIVDSTARLAATTDRRWCKVLDRLDAGVEQLVGCGGGHIASYTGDGYVAVFDGVSRAVRFGQLATGLARRTGVEVRVGVHAGEIEQQGAQIAGMAVHIASRIQDLAEPGEVLVTEPVLAISMGSGIDFLPRGETELRGLPGRWRLWTASS